MKTISLITIALFGFTLSAFADYVIQEKMEHNDGPPQEVTIKLKAGKARCDIGTGMSSIANAGEITLLMHAQKMAMKMPSMMMTPKNEGSANNPPAKLQPTGRKEKINGFDTEEYVHENPTLKAATHFWIAKDFPDKTEIMKMMTAMQTPMTKQLLQAAGTVSPEDFPGIPIRTEIESHLTSKPSHTTVTIVSIKKEAVDDSAFVVPADYHSSSMPGGPGDR